MPRGLCIPTGKDDQRVRVSVADEIGTKRMLQIIVDTWVPDEPLWRW